jgi:hypothetical protein
MSFGFSIKRNTTDKYFSDLVRLKANWCCERCHRDYSDHHQGLECSHFIGRGNKKTRWDFENAAALCTGCHIHFTKDAHEHAEFFRKRLGDEAYDALGVRSKLTMKGSGTDEKMIRIGLKMEWKELNDQLKSNIIGAR